MTDQTTEVSPLPFAAEHFDFDTLKKICEMHEDDFDTAFGMEKVVSLRHSAPDNFYLFKDNGSSILAVAHLDTVVTHKNRETVMHTPSQKVYSGALDDRLGAYVIADLLPKMGMKFDLLFTTGEENGQSTAEVFDPANHHDRQYNWIIEFDRGGTDVVMYQYEDDDLVERVEDVGAKVAPGIFSDIAFMEHLGIKGINWGVGYQNYHSVNGNVWLPDLFDMVDLFTDFHENNHDERLEHTPKPSASSLGLNYWEDEDWEDMTDGCEAEYWQVGECDGPLVEDPALGTLCEKHEQWANSTD